MGAGRTYTGGSLVLIFMEMGGKYMGYRPEVPALAVLLVVLFENFLRNTATDGAILSGSFVTIITLVQLNAQLVCHFVLHLIKSTVLLCHLDSPHFIV